MADLSATFAIIPGLPPPPGVVPNFVNPYSIHSITIAANVVGLTLAISSTLVRMYTKLFIIKNYGWEDYLVCFATLGLIPYCAVGLADLRYGAGVHQWNVTLLNVLKFARLGFIIEVLYPVVILPTKLSILLQYIRIFVPNHTSKTFYLVLSFLACNVAFFIASLLITVFQCTPIERAYNPLVKGNCINWPLAIVLTAVFNLVSDLCILLMPLTWIWRLQMSKNRKIGLSGIFLIGIFACAITVVRLYYSIRNNETQDSTYALVIVALCTMGEIVAGILVANLPILPRFFTYFGPKMSSSFRTSLYKLAPGTWSKASTDSSTSKKPKKPWQDQERKVPRPEDSYEELDGSTEVNASRTGLRKGEDSYSDEMSMHELVDLERGQLGPGAIEKTIRIQQTSVHGSR